MRVLGSYAVAYVLAGAGTYTAAQGIEASLTPGDLIVALPEIPHIYRPELEEFWSEIFIVFDGPVFDLWRDLGIQLGTGSQCPWLIVRMPVWSKGRRGSPIPERRSSLRFRTYPTRLHSSTDA